MLKGKLKTCIFAACFLLVSVAATAQEVVNALTGTVASIDAVAKTITVYTDNHSEGLFKDMTNSTKTFVLTQPQLIPSKRRGRT
jgi:hypothetical protein